MMKLFDPDYIQQAWGKELYEKGFKVGLREGLSKNWVTIVRNVMQNLQLKDTNEAMDLVGVPEELRQTVKELLQGKERIPLVYPFMTLDDGTEIVHSKKQPDGSVKVYIEKLDAKDCFHHMTCWLPSYRIEEVYKLSDQEVERYMEVIRSNAHRIMAFTK